MRLQDKLLQLKVEKKAILAVNFYNYETLVGILNAASGLRLPIILQLSENSIRYLGLKVAVAMAKAAVGESGVEGWLHLDHGSSVEIVKQCLDNGFDSVMIDASEKSLEENIKITELVVKIAQPYNANTEAELGYVAKLGQQQDCEGLTRLDDAVKFAEITGVNSLAVAIGSAHGFYRKPPQLNIDLLKQISASVSSPLVLHGSSGIPGPMLIEAIHNGICKVNLATETKNAFMKALAVKLKDNDEIDLRILFPDAINAVKDLVKGKLETILQA
jgi:ketose-bisphosphate aldolase